MAIRLLCSANDGQLRAFAGGWLVPVLSVGVQGDSRTYALILAVEQPVADASDLVNSNVEINRVITQVALRLPIPEMTVSRSYLTVNRMDRLRRADAVVRQLTEASGFDADIWQFPVVLIPLGTADAPDSVVLRPVRSVDGMTADAAEIPAALLSQLASELLAIEGIAGVFRDLTDKPPATIEWE